MAHTRLPSTVGSQPHASAMASTTCNRAPRRQTGRPASAQAPAGSDPAPRAAPGHRCAGPRSCNQPGVDHGVRHQFREHQHSIVARATTTLMEPGPNGAPSHSHHRVVVIEQQGHHPASRPIKCAISNDDCSNDAAEAATSLPPLTHPDKGVARVWSDGQQQRYPTCRVRNPRPGPRSLVPPSCGEHARATLQLIALVVDGSKRAKAGALVSYEQDGVAWSLTGPLRLKMASASNA